MCECESWKIKYLQKAFPDTPMLFDDMRRLGSGRAFDANTKTVKDVPKALGSKIVFKCSFDMDNRASNLEKWNVIISCFKKFFQDVLDLAAPDRKQFLECFFAIIRLHTHPFTWSGQCCRHWILMQILEQAEQLCTELHRPHLQVRIWLLWAHGLCGLCPTKLGGG